MQRREVIVTNTRGLHARAAAQLVHHAVRFRSTVELVCNGKRANARHFIAVLVLAASMGARVGVEASGPDEAEAMTAVVQLFSNGFGERG